MGVSRPSVSGLRTNRRAAEHAALVCAIILLTATCFGQGVGPLAVGMINDALKDDYRAVRHSLLSAAATATLGVLLLVWAAPSIRGDIERAT